MFLERKTNTENIPQNNIKVLIVDYEETGAILFNLAHSINTHDFGVTCIYASFQNTNNRAHDSNTFHFGDTHFEWDYSKQFEEECCGVALYNFKKKIAYLKKIFRKFSPDLVLTSGRGGYLCCKANIDYTYWVYGSDLEHYAFNNLGAHNSPDNQQTMIYNFIHNKKLPDNSNRSIPIIADNPWSYGIKHAQYIIVPPRSLHHLKQIVSKIKIIHAPHCLAAELPPKKIEPHKKLEHKKKFLSVTRHVWGENRRHLTDYKANNIIVHAISNYKKKTNDTEFELQFIKKGSDVERTRLLLKQLDLEKETSWFDEMSREKLSQLYNNASICFSQFGTDTLEFSAIEPLSFGIPVISWYGNLENNPIGNIPFYKEHPPIFNSKNPDLISDYMIDIMAKPDRYDTVCNDAYHWCKSHCSLECFATFLKKTTKHEVAYTMFEGEII